MSTPRTRRLRPLLPLVSLLCLLGTGTGYTEIIPDPPGGGGGGPAEYIVDGAFNSGMAYWLGYVHDDGTGPYGSIAVEPNNGNNVVRITVDRADPVYVWKVMLRQQDQALNNLQPSTDYVLNLRARSLDVDRPTSIELEYRDAGGGVHYYHIAELTVKASATLQPYALTIRTPDNLALVAGTARILSFSSAQTTGTMWLDDIHLNDAVPLTFQGSDLVVSSFLPGAAWQSDDPPKALVPDSSGLHLSIPADGLVFAYRHLLLNLDATPWDMVLTLSVADPTTIGRMYVMLRSGPADFNSSCPLCYVQYEFLSFGGLRQGTNSIIIRHDDFYRPWFATNFDLSRIHTVGIKLESNGNGPANVTLQSLHVIPWSGNPLHSSPRPPVVSRVNVISVGPAGATIQWTTDQPSSSVVDYGMTTAYGPPASVPGSETDHTVPLTGLQASTLYHVRISSHGTVPQDGQSGDFTFTTEPSSPWVPGGSAGDFPLGIFSVPEPSDVPFALNAGFNRVHSYMASTACKDDGTYEGTVDQYLTQVLNWNGKGAMLSSFCPSKIYDPSFPPTEQPPLDMTHIENRVTLLKDKTNLLAYYAYDEPEGVDPAGGELHRRLKAIYERIKGPDPQPLDPMGTVFMGTFLLGPIADYPYNDVLDHATLDTYPIPQHPADFITCSLKKAELSGKKYDFSVQAYSPELDRHWPGTAPPGPTRFASLAEMRAMTYLSLAHGASGVWAYAFHEIVPFSGTEWVWGNLTSLFRELKRLEPVLSLGSELPQGSITLTADGTGGCQTIEALAKTYQSQTYILAVNRKTAYEVPDPNHPGQLMPLCTYYSPVPGCPATPVATAATIKLVGPYVGPVQVLGESRPPIPLTGGQFTDNFGAIGTHLYRVCTDLQPPVPAITAPAVNGTISGTAATLSATATDDCQVVSLAFRIDGPTSLDGGPTVTDSSSPYGVGYNTTTLLNGVNTLVVTATDTQGHTGTDSRAVRVANGDQTAPTGVVINTPGPGTTVPNPVVVKVSGNDNKGIRRLELWEGNVRVATRDFTPPKKTINKEPFSWNTTSGNHTLKARAIDTDNNYTWSAAVAFHVQ